MADSGVDPGTQGPHAGPITDDTQLVQAERALLDDGGEREKRRGVKNPLWSGIGLSGGGIRSASFCLGVMQSLAGAKLLSKFDYMSSVSGGSFIAASLQWYWHERDASRVPVYDAEEKFPYGSKGPDDGESAEPAPLTFLRDNASYLTAGRGINVWSGIAVVLRTAIISCAVWFSLLVLLNAIAMLAQKAMFGWTAPLGMPNVLYALLLLACAICLCAAVISALAFGLLSVIRPDVAFSPRYLLPAWVSAGAAMATLLATVLGALFARQVFSGGLDASLTAILFVVGILSAAWLVGSVALIRGAGARQNAGYWLRRFQERSAGILLVVVVGTFVVGIVPLVADLLRDRWPEDAPSAPIAGTVGVVLTLAAGIASSVYAFYTLVQNVRPGLLGRYLPQIGAALFLYGTLVGSYLAAQGLVSVVGQPAIQWRTPLVAIVLVLGALGLVILVVANVNQIGLHRFYRDRLLETFMPDDARPTGPASAAPFADRFTISRVWGRRDCPYPIINTNVILSQDGEGRPERRGGDSFIFSPMFIGSDTTGWLDTDVYAKRHGPVTLASAMAVSGAAINSNAGYVGTGPTRNPLVSAAMTFLNVRLGIWLRNPRLKAGRFGFYPPTYLWPTLGILLGKGHRPKDRFIEVSDGGHFDNLGLYELIRRKLDLILIVDGEGDAAVSLPAFVSIVRRVREDFGARILVEANGSGPERLLPVTAAGAGYPMEARFAKSSFFTCQVRYADGTKGLLIYLKATLLADSYFTTRGYRARNPDFPHQTTADQFFDPVQFESYRELGYVCAKHMINATGLDTLFEDQHALKARIASLTPGS